MPSGLEIYTFSDTGKLAVESVHGFFFEKGA